MRIFQTSGDLVLFNDPTPEQIRDAHAAMKGGDAVFEFEQGPVKYALAGRHIIRITVGEMQERRQDTPTSRQY
jgi:hypothetical protein